MRVHIRLFFLFAFLFSGAFIASGQTYDFHNFNVEDGLAQSQVLSICQDRTGNIWFGTNSGGVSRYDGNKFVTLSENDSLVNNVVFSITELNSGKILFGTNGGLSIYNGKTFINFTDKNGLPHNRVFKTIQDNQGTVWIGTAQGVCQLQNNKIIPFTGDTLLDKAAVFTIYADKVGNIWFGTISQGAIKYNLSTKRFNHYSKATGLSYNFVRAFNEDIQGSVYVGTNAGISKIGPIGTIERVNIPKQENVAFTDIVSDNKNNLWMATNEGIYKYNGFICKNYK
jgi:ligand-binding sensor domain-containing protein